MLRAFWISSLVLFLAGLLIADDKEDAAKKELEKFQGEWHLVQSDEITLKIKGAEYVFDGGGQVEKGRFKFNPAVTPAEVDVDITEGTDAGKKQVGIYELKGDKVKFCFALAGETKRPKKFEAAEDGSIILFEFVKVKK
jgi:uncharacterized protein (TIGR03067 family)